MLGTKPGLLAAFYFGGRRQEQFKSIHVFEVYFGNVFFAEIANHIDAGDLLDLGLLFRRGCLSRLFRLCLQEHRTIRPL